MLGYSGKSTSRNSFSNGALLWVILVFSAILKLMLAEPDYLFEAHDIAVEMQRSGEMRMLQHGQWHYHYQFPVYPALVYCMYSMGIGAYGVLIFNIILGTLTALLVYHLTLLLTGQAQKRKLPLSREWPAIIAATVIAFNPYLAYYQVKMVHPFALDVFFAMLISYLGFKLKIFTNKGLIWWALACGLAILNRPTLVVFCLFALPLLIKQLKLLKIKTIVLSAALILLPVSAWVVRNGSIADDYSLSSASGQNLWIGIQGETQGTAITATGENYMSLLTDDERQEVYGLSASHQSDWFKAKYQEELAAKPNLFLEMFLIKLQNFWFGRADAGVYHNSGYVGVAAVIYRYFSAILLLSLIGLLIIRFRESLWPLFVLLLFSVLQSFYYVETRHRLLLDPLLIVFMVVFIVSLLKLRKANN
jgi:hypothetical protein